MNNLLDFLCDNSPLRLPELFHGNSEMDFCETLETSENFCNEFFAVTHEPVAIIKKEKFLFTYHEDGYIIPKNGYEKLIDSTSKKAVKEKISDAIMNDSYMAYSEWGDCGYYLIKGSKSTTRDALNIPQFSLDQVKK